MVTTALLMVVLRYNEISWGDYENFETKQVYKIFPIPTIFNVTGWCWAYYWANVADFVEQ
jgi:hypothetical protein